MKKKENISTKIGTVEQPRQSAMIALLKAGKPKASRIGQGVGKIHAPAMTEAKPGGMMALKPVKPTKLK